MGVFRSEELNQLYHVEKQTEEFKTKCALCSCTPLKMFTHWKIAEAKYPYDRVASTHHMLLPLRHADERELTIEEADEFLQIKHSDAIQHVYDSFIESTQRTRSIPPHFHLHLLVLK